MQPDKQYLLGFAQEAVGVHGKAMESAWENPGRLSERGKFKLIYVKDT